jgi:hypothetical protein
MNIGRGARSISFAVKLEIQDKPCVICGFSGDTHVDHILPVANGGTRELSNLQPLCWQCNKKKSNRLTNEQLREWFNSRRKEHFDRHRWHMTMKRIPSPFDRISFREWMNSQQVGTVNA